MKTLELHILRDDEGKFTIKCDADTLPIQVIETILNDVAQKVEDITANKILGFLDKATDGLVSKITENLKQAEKNGDPVTSVEEYIAAFKAEGGKLH